MHEAAHVIVLMSFGVNAFFVHMSPVLGHKRIGIMPKFDGFFAGPLSRDNIGPVSIAGMVQDKADWLGPSDAMALIQWLTMYEDIGPRPSKRPAATMKKIGEARRYAKTILRREQRAVRAVADLLLTPGRVHFDGTEIRDVVTPHSVALPELSEQGASAADCWMRGLAGDKDQLAILEFSGMGDLVKLVIRERTKKSRARRPNP